MVDLLLTHKHLERLHVRFQDVSGFTSLIAKAFDTATPLLHTLTIINIRDYDYPELTKLLTEMSVRLDGEESMTDVGSRWQALEQRQLAKYGWLSHLKLSHLTFGFCHAWPASVWRQFLVLAPHLDYLELHGWTRLLLYRLHSVAMPVQTEAQLVLIQCFGALTALTRLVLVDFWVTAEMRLPTHSNASICLQYTAEALHKPDALKLLMDVQAFVLVHARHAIQVLFDKSWDRYLTGFNGVL
ncbi:hypothetical protein BJV82DRAFT_575592 [Fennellomyces sp. T-0311]|nr:hypothetical protein BJV82DRAFT_575592 [Fennellomyces sp. T-0311]